VPGEQFTGSADLREDDKNPDVTAFEEAALAYADYQYRKAATLLELRCSHTQDYPAMTLLAKCYANLGELDKAHLWCERAIRANKLNPNTYYLLATVLHEKGIEHLAINALKQAITLNSKFVLAEFTLGNLLKQRGDRAGAEQLFRATLKLLEEYNDDDIIPESGGTTANGLKVIVTSILSEFVRTK
jgi:chemotaxis protein methyltransferase CheR